MTRFSLRFLAWFISFFSIWFLSASWWGLAVAWLCNVGLSWLFPWVVEVNQQGQFLILMTSIHIPYSNGVSFVPSPRVNYLAHGFGLPFYFALIMAAQAKKPMLKMLAGSFILLPLISFNVAMSWFRQLFIKNSFGSYANLDFQEWQLNLLEMGLKFGLLILPTLIPVLIWVYFERRFVMSHFVSGWIDGAVK